MVEAWVTSDRLASSATIVILADSLSTVREIVCACEIVELVEDFVTVTGMLAGATTVRVVLGIKKLTMWTDTDSVTVTVSETLVVGIADI